MNVFPWISILLLFSLNIVVAEQPYNFVWAQGASGGVPYGLTIDGLKNTYVCGYFGTAATFGGTTVTNGGNSAAFLAKYDSQGNFQWVRNTSGGTGTGAQGGAAVFSNGSIYLVGKFTGPLTIGNTNLTNRSGFFLAKYDTSGQVSSDVGQGSVI